MLPLNIPHWLFFPSEQTLYVHFRTKELTHTLISLKNKFEAEQMYFMRLKASFTEEFGDSLLWNISVPWHSEKGIISLPESYICLFYMFLHI